MDVFTFSFPSLKSSERHNNFTRKLATFVCFTFQFDTINFTTPLVYKTIHLNRKHVNTRVMQSKEVIIYFKRRLRLSVNLGTLLSFSRSRLSHYCADKDYRRRSQVNELQSLPVCMG